MKNISLILNLVLLAAVAFLYVKIYSPDSSPAVSGSVTDDADSPISNRIVYLNSDSLLNNYDYFIGLSDALDKKQDSIENILKQKASSLEKEIAAYQQKAPGMTQEEMMKTEELLMKKQQSVIDLKDRLFDSLKDEEIGMNDSIHNNLNAFLKEFNKDKNYLFILGYQRGSGILFANDSLDITNEVIEGINAQ
jgi:outer membrane protein